MKTYGSYNENNEEKYQSSEKRFKEALAKIENLEGKFCDWEKAPKAGVGVLTSKDNKLQILTWDWQSGGTMHEYGSIWRYQLPNGTWKTEFNELDSDSDITSCIQSLKMRNKETNRDWAGIFGNKWDGFR